MTRKSERPEPWFRVAITAGLQGMVAMAPRGTPHPDIIATTYDVWAVTLWAVPSIHWDEELDRGRLAEAFVRLAGAIDRWPLPKQLLEHLGPRVERVAIEHKQSPEEIERNKARWRALRDSLRLKQMPRA